MSNKNKSVASKKVGRKKIEKLIQLGEKGGGNWNGLYSVCPVKNNC